VGRRSEYSVSLYNFAVAGEKFVTQAVPTQSGFLPRMGRFLRKPWPEKIRAAGLFARSVFPNLPIPVRTHSGLWCLAWQNDLGNHFLAGDFEEPEYAFVQRFLKPGMTVLDIGANEGYYTVLASKCVGPRGRVIGFEPSPRERRHLQMNLRLNGCNNVRIEKLALGSAEGQVNLHVVEGSETGCNSLRPPDIKGKTRAVQVDVTTVDLFLHRNAIPPIDFIKMDIEGAELSALQGAAKLLGTVPRPLLLIEIFEIRTRPWGYSARDLSKLICEAGYLLHTVVGNGDLVPVDAAADFFDANFIAVPEERVSEISNFLAAQETKYVRC
jgi:FkbM family methyltransferase